MGAEQKTHFQIDKFKCIKCSKCINTCSGMVIEFGADGYPKMKEFERFGWRGFWRCQHCLAVCPVGAISIFGKKPEDSLLPGYTCEISEAIPAQMPAAVMPGISGEKILLNCFSKYLCMELLGGSAAGFVSPEEEPGILFSRKKSTHFFAFPGPTTTSI